MLAKRIIPCLDIKDGRTVKGVRFETLRDAGDPVELAAWYCTQGADELVFLDITATDENRKTFTSLIKEIASVINIPFCVGGGINSEKNVYDLLNAGADKVSVNSAAFNDPDLISRIAKHYGSQCMVLAMDVMESGNLKEVVINCGKIKTGKNAVIWAKEGAERGAGEILLTSVQTDGTRSGYAVNLTREISGSVHIPVIASGGAGKKIHFQEVFKNAGADAALAASVFHYKQIEIPELKKYLKENGISIR